MGAARTQLCTSAFALLYSVGRLICRSLDSDHSGRNVWGCREPLLQPESSPLPRPAVSSGLRAGCGCGILLALLPSLLLFAPLQMFWCLDLTRVCVLVQGINSCSTCNFMGRAQEPVTLLCFWCHSNTLVSYFVFHRNWKTRFLFSNFYNLILTCIQNDLLFPQVILFCFNVGKVVEMK